MTERFHQYTISQDKEVIDALRILNDLSGECDTLFALDAESRLMGTITDGDLRRSLISGGDLHTPLHRVMHRNFSAIRSGAVDVKQIQAMRRLGITLVPHLNADGTIRTIYDFSKCQSLLPIDAVLMAGGRGERLRPLTLSTPKPLLKVGDKCIIDYNVEALIRNGISHISVTTNYLHEQIEEHFAGAFADTDVHVQCINEPCRMGTIGSLQLVPEFFNEHILLMNSDLLTTINYEDLYLNHIASGAALTVATVPYVLSVPYAIMRLEGNEVKGFEEKPTFNYFANAGIYLFRRDLIDLIPKGEYFDATDFMESLIASGERINQFPINGTWIDIGSPDDYRQAQELMKQHKLLRL